MHREAAHVRIRRPPRLRTVLVYAFDDVESDLHPDVQSSRQRTQRFRAELRRLEA